MSLHWTYRDDGPVDELEQGDVLLRTAEIDVLLREYYPRYAANEENQHFLVLTQSCDLVPRDGICTAKYISLAPVRPIETAMRRKLAEFVRHDLSSDPPVCGTFGEARLREWLERLYNNNEANYFYLRNQPDKGLAEDSCAFLALSIAIKSELHYSACLAARIVGLTPVFQAKLGWLVGQMYSRVGTPDWQLDKLNGEIAAALEDLAIWVEDRHAKALKRLIKEWREKNAGADLSKEILLELIKKIPKRKLQVVDRVLTLLFDSNMVAGQDQKRVSNMIRNDPELAALLAE